MTATFRTVDLAAALDSPPSHANWWALRFLGKPKVGAGHHLSFTRGEIAVGRALRDWFGAGGGTHVNPPAARVAEDLAHFAPRHFDGDQPLYIAHTPQGIVACHSAEGLVWLMHHQGPVTYIDVQAVLAELAP